MERSETSEAVGSTARASALIDALATAASRLGADLPWVALIDDLLSTIGRAAGASRMFLARDWRTADGQAARSVESEWCAPGVASAFAEGRSQLAQTDPRFGCAALSLEEGPAVTTQSCGDPAETEALHALEVSAITVVRVDASGHRWGVMGAHHRTGDPGPTALALKVLAALSAVIGSAIGRTVGELPARQIEDFIESIPAVLYIDDLSKHVSTTYVAPQIERLLGISQAEWLSENDAWQRHIHPEDWERVNREYEEFLAAAGAEAEPDVLRQEYRMIRADGRTIWVRDELSLVHDSPASLGLVRGLMYDITEQKVLQDRLMAADDRIRALTEALSEMEANRRS